MDHLPLPENVTEHLAVPYLPGIAYDSQGFTGYDTRQGWNIQQLRQGNIRTAREEWHDYSQAALQRHDDTESESGVTPIQLLVGSFVQNWLLCGLFQAALGRPIEEADYVVTLSVSSSSKTRYLTTGKLFAEFVSRRGDLCNDKESLTSLRDCIDQAGYILEDIDDLSEELHSFVIPGPTHLMLASVVQALDQYICYWFRLPVRSAAISHARWLEEQLLDRGWCLNQVTKIRGEIGLGGLYYASLLAEVKDNADHTRCDQEVCVAYNIENDELYTQEHQPLSCCCHEPGCKHQSETCACFAASMGSNISDMVKDIVLQGKIPLIQVDQERDNVHFVVTEFDTDVDYVAVSHVWSDGMGNPSGNSIPACQAEYLSRCAANVLGNSKLFWIDTLCVPRWPVEAREKALTKMDEAYENARYVLVFSSELTSVRLPSTSDEILIRIAKSKWLTRLWTMQEGVLAKELVFQFADKAVDFAYVKDIAQRNLLKTSRVSHFPAIQASLMVSHMLSFYKDEGRNGSALKSLWFSIRHRATSKSKDEAICAAILLRVSLEAIFAASVGESMLAFWQTLKYIPLSILWVNGPRYEIKGAGWAPKSLLNPRTWAVPIEDSPDVAMVSSHGLYFHNIESFYFPQIECPLAEDSLIKFATADTDDEYHLILAENVGNRSWKELSSVWEHVVLLWNSEGTHQFVQGVLASVTSDIQILMSFASNSAPVDADDVVVHAKWLAQVTVMRKGSDFDQMMSNMPSRSSKDGSPMQHPLDILAYSATPVTIPKRCRWCLG